MLMNEMAKGRCHATRVGQSRTRNREIPVFEHSNPFTTTLLLLLPRIRVLALGKQLNTRHFSHLGPGHQT